MVRGLDTFRKYFEEFPDNYIIIGGTACDIILDGAGFKARATKDIDIILVVEAVKSDFVRQFWQFIQDGKYERNEISADEKRYYRFLNPEEKSFPFQIELFARNPDLIDLNDEVHITPIPVDDDLSSLSAILLEDDYYYFVIEHSTPKEKLNLANIETLICLKAKAYLDIAERLASGGNEDKKKLRKHSGDVFRLAAMLAEKDRFDLPEVIKSDLQKFIDTIAEDLPDKAILKEMGLNRISVRDIRNQIIKSFHLI